MSSLLLLRHGQASFGADDYDRLSELGLRQAASAGEHFVRQGLAFDRVLSGPLRRQVGTAEGALAAMGVAPAIEVEPALLEFAEAQQVLDSAERQAGIPLRGEHAPPRRVQLQHYDALIAAWAAGDAVIDGQPPMRDFRARVGGWLRRIVDDPAPSQRLLAATSAGVIGTLVCEVLGLPDARMIEFTRMVFNASLTEIVFQPGRCSLLSFNSTAHLPPGLSSPT